MVNAIQAEWLKLSQRPMAWVLLIIFLVQMALVLSLFFLAIGLQDGIFFGADNQVALSLLPEEKIDEFRRRISFPGILGEVLGQINGIGGICAVILAGAALGSEYHWGTLRVQLARHPNRGRYLIAKVITLLLILLAGILLSLIVGILLGILYGTVLGNLGSVSMRDIMLLPLGVARSLYVMLPYLMFTIAMCTIGRSAMAGIAGGMIFLVLDVSTGMPSFLKIVDNPTIAMLYNLLIQQNVNALVLLNWTAYGLDPSVSMNMDPAQLPSPLQATLVVGVYSLLFLAYAYVWLTRRDVTGAT